MLLLQAPDSPVYALAFSPDGAMFVTGTKSGAVQHWTDDGPVELFPPGVLPEGAVHAIDFHPDGHSLIVGGVQGAIGRSNLDAANMVVFRPHVLGRVTAVKYLSPTLVAVGTGDRSRAAAGALALWDSTIKRTREPRLTSTEGVRGLSVLPAKKTVAWSEWNRRVNVWEITQAEPVRFNLGHAPGAISLRADGLQLAVAVEWTVKLFDLDKRYQSHDLKGHKGPVTGVSYSPDGRKLVSGSWDGTVRFWDVNTGVEQACFVWPVGKIVSLAFSPDGLRLAVGGDRGTILLFDLE